MVTKLKKESYMQDCPQIALKVNPIQAKLREFIEIINPIYQKLDPAIRLRRNHQHLIASDVVSIMSWWLGNYAYQNGRVTLGVVRH